MFELLNLSGSERQQKAFGLNYCAASFVTEGQPPVLSPLLLVYPCGPQARHFLIAWVAVDLAETPPHPSQEKSGTALRSCSATTSSTPPSPTTKLGAF